MSDATCPTDEVSAPIDMVWRLLTEPAGWGAFFDVRILYVDPPGVASVGQRFWGESGPRWLHLRVSFVYTLVDVEHWRVGLDVDLPLRIKVREDLNCVPLGPDRCRVTYHCNFEFSHGWRGGLARRLLGRTLESGPADSLVRLKNEAEAQARAGRRIELPR